MRDAKEKPDCAHDNAAIAACFLNQIWAVVSSIKYLHGIPGEGHHLPHLTDIAIQLAMDGAEHFEKQIELHEALDNEKKEPKA